MSLKTYTLSVFLAAIIGLLWGGIVYVIQDRVHVTLVAWIEKLLLIGRKSGHSSLRSPHSFIWFGLARRNPLNPLWNRH